MATGTNTFQQSKGMLASTYELPLLPLPTSIETPQSLERLPAPIDI